MPESRLLEIIEVLLGEHEHRVIVKGVLDRGKGHFVERPKIDPLDNRAERGRRWSDHDLHAAS